MCVLSMGISGSQSGCRLLFPWVAWLSLGLDGVCVMGGVSSRGFSGWPVVRFGLVPLQAGWFLAWPLSGAFGMGGAAHPCVTSSSLLGDLWWLLCKSHPAPARGSLEAQGKLQTLVSPRLGQGHPEALEMGIQALAKSRLLPGAQG